MVMVRTLFEMVPIFFAFVAAIQCSRVVLNNDNCRRNARLAFGLAILSAIILIFNQSSWLTAVVIEHVTKDADIINLLWTVFNSVVMFTFILFAESAMPRIKK